jgi:uncharacterized protein
MIVGSLRLTLRLAGCRSLKEKRAPRRSITSRIRTTFKVAVAEVDDQDLWNSLVLGIAAVGPDRGPVERVLRDVADFVEEQGIGELIEEVVDIHRP